MATQTAPQLSKREPPTPSTKRLALAGSEGFEQALHELRRALLEKIGPLGQRSHG